MIEQLPIVDVRALLNTIEGIDQSTTLPWLYLIPDPFKVQTITAQIVQMGLRFGVEIGCAHEPTRAYLINPGLWLAYNPGNGPASYFRNARFDFEPTDLLGIPPSYALILIPTEFHYSLFPPELIHTLLFRNPDHKPVGDTCTFDELPSYERLHSNQRLVLVSDQSGYGGPYSELLQKKGYHSADLQDWRGAPLTSDKPRNREVSAKIFDITKT